MGKVIMEAKGLNGQLELSEDRITIKRKGITGVFGGLGKGDRVILLSDISSVAFKKPGISYGYIQFTFAGGKTDLRVMSAGYDDNTVIFQHWQLKAFESIKTAIERKMAALKSGKGANPGLDELERLASLRDKGIITQEEFNAKKKQILGL